MRQFFIIFACLLPVSIVLQFVRSRWFSRQDRHTGADIVEAAGLALALSLGAQGTTLFPQWPSYISPFVLMLAVYFPICIAADWIRKGRRDA
jgi:hypothetical protein